jgi:hypothetical protein
MSRAIYRGTSLPLQQRFSEHYSPTNGVTRDFLWRGHDFSRIQLLASQLVSVGAEYEYTFENGSHVLRAIDTSGEIAIDTWEMGLNRLLPSSFENPRNINSISPVHLALIKFAIEMGLKPNDAVEEFNASPELVLQYGSATWPTSSTSAGEAALALYDRVSKGSVSYTYSSYVLRHTTNVSNRWARNVSDVNVDCIYTTAQLLSEAENGNLWVYPLPGRLAYKILSLDAPPARDRYLWGWLKSGSAESTAANNRVNIVTEYELGQWSTDEYSTV